MTEIKKWKRLNSKYIINNQHCKVRQDTVKLTNNTIVKDYFVNERPDIAMVFALTKTNKIIMVKQYRHGTQEILLELPAGTFDKQKEKAEEAAKRELLEETGYQAKNLIKLGEWSDFPTKDTNKIHAFLTTKTRKKQEPKPEPTEHIEIKLIKTSKAIEMIKNGKIKVAGTIATILLALKKLENTKTKS